MLTFDQKQIIFNTISHPAFKFDDSIGKDFYTEEKLETLFSAIELLQEKIYTERLDLPMIQRVEAIIASGTPDFPCNFNQHYATEFEGERIPDERLHGRTAYGLLCTNDGSNCVGIAETCCILLNLEGYEATPIISKLLKSSQESCHYITAVKDKEGNIVLVDPDRKRSCDEKNWSLLAYQSNIEYASPDQEFAEKKVSGPKGLGPLFYDFINSGDRIYSKPKVALSVEHPELFDESGRLPIGLAEMTRERKEILQTNLTENLSPIYEHSLSMSVGIKKAERMVA